MIISASRRTDIPALYSEWFMNRIRAGWCLVPNPMNMKQVSLVSLRPQEVDAIVFWSKNPAPMIPYLGELSAMGFRYYFQFTLNDYPGELEPNIPSFDNRLGTFLKLSELIGSIRVVWRYDPIIISNVTPFDFHRERFRSIAEELRGATNRVMVSIVDFYQKTDRRLAQLEGQGFLFDKEAEYSTEMVSLLKDMADIARKQGMEIYTCAEARDYSEFGIPPGRCIDEELLRKIWVLHLKYKKDPSQRELCLCMVSKDIGINDTCIHGCPYCYSTRNYALAERRYKEHDPSAPALWENSENPIESNAVVSEQMKLSI
jgi:DNA repair photolyase